MFQETEEEAGAWSQRPFFFYIYIKKLIFIRDCSVIIKSLRENHVIPIKVQTFIYLFSSCLRKFNYQELFSCLKKETFF